MIVFRRYREDDYEAICDFLLALNQEDKAHINWSWARFEWMMEHREFDKDSMNTIGLWTEDDAVVGAAIYDMYFGEAFAGVLPGYEDLYPEVLSYAYEALKDEGGLGISVCDDNAVKIEALKKAGFAAADQTETIMALDLTGVLPVVLPEGFCIKELDPGEEPMEFQWLLWQGFDHGNDKDEFLKEEEIIPQIRPHFRKELSLTAVDDTGRKTAYACVWYHKNTDYAYIEPVCTVPEFRGRGLARALLFEALNRAKKLGASKAYVISDEEFYEKLGFLKTAHFTFYWKE